MMINTKNMLTPNAKNFHENNLVGEMSHEDWESWHSFMAQEEKKVAKSLNLTNDQKLEALYNYQIKHIENLEAANIVIEHKLKENNMTMAEFVNYVCKKETR